MTEAEWLAADRPWPILDAFAERASARKLRLFSCACCRSASRLAGTPAYEAAVEVLERFADGAAGDAERARALAVDLPSARPGQFVGAGLLRELRAAGAEVVGRVAGQLGQRAAEAAGYSDARRFSSGEGEELARQVPLLRDILGNPFRPVAFPPRWRTDTVVTLARQMYEGRDFSAMPILADALQDAGCERAEVLDHCRGEGPHVRGCWVIDLVLGKA
jgi:hypothetical protein